MITEVRTPFGTPSAIELSKDGLYRKQILRFQTINYTGRDGRKRKITFDQDYGRDLIKAFREGAYDQVPFQLADNDNRHNNSPLLTGGEAVALAMSPDGSGVDAVLKLNDQGRKAVELNAKLGVSARILENAELGGRTFPRAVQHILGTVDPQVRGMSPWQKVESVDLSGGAVSESVDLSAATYEGSARMPGRDDGEMTTLELSVSQRDRLLEMLEEDEGLQELADQLEALGIDLTDDEEVEEVDDEPDSDDDEENDDLDLSNPATRAIELTNATVDSLESRVVELTNQLATQRLETENANYRREGLAPAVLEAAAPLLALESGALELSNSVGDAVDPGDVIRAVLDTVIELSSTGHLIVDPMAETGSHQAEDPDTSRRDAMLNAWSTEYGH